jgi:hypothetical protein
MKCTPLFLAAILLQGIAIAQTPSPAPASPIPSPSASPAEEDADPAVRYNQLLDEWRKAGSKGDQDVRDNLIDAAVTASTEAADPAAINTVIEEVGMGVDPAKIEIQLPATATNVSAKLVRDLGPIPDVPFNDGVMDIVIRRITPANFEAWTPKHGWLFDSKGRVLNEAKPPRRDGIGREWHGAFIPDGHWITTDLWERDDTLYFFSPAGKLQRQFKAADLAPEQGDWRGTNLIAWARGDRQGRGWVANLGSEGGWARVFITPTGKPEILQDADAPWKLCYTRDLEPKGFYIQLHRPADDLKFSIDYQSAGHGSWVGFPTYSWGDNVRIVIPDGGNNFGFLPGTHSPFITIQHYNKDPFRTWFFDSAGKCLGWAAADYFADAPGLKGIWLVDADNVVNTLDLALKPQSKLRFTLNGADATPIKLFPDLKLGFFKSGNHALLAKW